MGRLAANVVAGAILVAWVGLVAVPHSRMDREVAPGLSTVIWRSLWARSFYPSLSACGFEERLERNWRGHEPKAEDAVKLLFESGILL